MNKKKLYKEIIKQLEDGYHPADVYEELVDEHGNLSKNTIFETVVKAYNAINNKAVTA